MDRLHGTTGAAGQDARSWWRELTTSPVVALGLFLSVLLHTALLVAAAFLIMRPGGDAGFADDGVEVAVMTNAELTEMLVEELGTPESAPLAVAAPDLASVDISGLLAAPDAWSQDAGELDLLGGSGATLASDLEIEGASGGGTASFFGVEAQGTRFAYIVDVSGSMNNGDRLPSLKNELIASITSLPPHAQFIVLLYSGDARVLSGATQWRKATDEHKLEATRDVRAIDANGITNPLSAFQIAFTRLSPRPDAVYFMTDGDITEENRDVEFDIAELNERHGRRARIYCIAFDVMTDARAVLIRIARRSGGSYTHVDRARRR